MWAAGKRVFVRDTAQRVVVWDTAQRVVVRGTAQHVVVRDTAQRVVVRDTAQRVVVRDAAQHVVVRDTAQRVVVRDTARVVVRASVRPVERSMHVRVRLNRFENRPKRVGTEFAPAPPMQTHVNAITVYYRRCSLPQAALVAVVLSGCSSVSGGIKDPAGPTDGPSVLAAGSQISAVDVSLNQNELPSEVTEVAEQYEVTRILTNRLRDQLPAQAENAAGALEVKVDIIGMRLRSNGTAIWWGFMAGSDWVTVDVEVLQGGRAVKTFQTGTSTSLGGFTMGGRSSRVARMMKTLAKRIAQAI